MSHPARQRDLIVINRRTGVITHTTEILPGASLEERIAGLKAVVPPDFGPGVRMCGVRCDGCGRIEEVDYDQPRLPAGWITRDSEEFCPGCQP